MRRTLIAAGLALAAWLARADDTIKVGVVAPFSGPFADYGKEMETGIKAWQKEHGDRAAGKRIEVILRDTTGPVPEVARRLAQELVVRDQVDFLAGFGLTPEALAVADVATQARKPMIVMNAASSVITTKSPFIARFSMTLPQIATPLATWAAKSGIKTVFTLVSDYAPGIDAETAFKTAFTAAGGRIVDSVRTPLRNPEFAPFIQRIKDAAPEAVFVFVPAGEQGIAFMKGFEERGLKEAGIKVIATGDLTDDNVIDAMGDVSLGLITAFHYSAAHDSPENRAFQKVAEGVGTGVRRPNFMAVAAYDGMAAIYQVVEKLHGKVDGEAAMKVLEGFKRESPRGPIAIDPATRDIVQTVYLRRVERRGDHLFNIEFDRVPDVKDPGK
jgi:branched-chain amino acid transport system substrate-binding protein